jgi:hypothetical protein
VNDRVLLPNRVATGGIVMDVVDGTSTR